jgi:hypothetical protein
LSAQVVEPQVVPEGALMVQAPVPLQVPSAPQGGVEEQVPWRAGGVVSYLTGPQVPSVVADCLSAAVQAKQMVSQAVSQQTPSMQWFVAQARQLVWRQSEEAARLQAVDWGFRCWQLALAAQ